MGRCSTAPKVGQYAVQFVVSFHPETCMSGPHIAAATRQAHRLPQASRHVIPLVHIFAGDAVPWHALKLGISIQQKGGRTRGKQVNLGGHVGVAIVSFTCWTLTLFIASSRRAGARAASRCTWAAMWRRSPRRGPTTVPPSSTGPTTRR